MSNLLKNNDLRDFLNYLEEDDLIKLALTTTQKLVKESEIQNKNGRLCSIFENKFSNFKFQKR